MPLFTARVLNSTARMGLPPMDLLISTSTFSIMAKDTKELILDETTTVIEGEQLNRGGYTSKKGKRNPRRCNASEEVSSLDQSHFS